MTTDEKTSEIPTRNKVAEAAGVSSATVSRVYNSPGSVSPEKQTAVLAAAERLGYKPNKSASALRRNGTGIITLIELKKKKREYYWGDLSLFKWFHTDVIHAVQEVIDGSMFQLNLATAATSADLDKLKGSTDGLICYDVDMKAEADMIASAGIPYIIGHHTKNFEGHPRCSTDNTKGGVLQARLLMDAGCRRPLYITAYTDNVKPNKDRLTGFLSVFKKDEVTIIESEVGREAGRKAVESVIQALKSGKIDGIAAVNDITAAGAGYALEAAGFRVQHDIPLAGYDNMPFGAALPFGLLSVDLRPAEIYFRAACLLLDILSSTVKTDTIIVPPIPILDNQYS